MAREVTGAPRPRAFALELTKGCNLRCAYCYYADREDAYQPATRMSPEVARSSVDRLFTDGPQDEPVRVHFFGGEPLLAFPLLVETVEYAERRANELGREVEFEVTTNGTRLEEPVIAFLNAHRVHVGVSFDGPPEVQDAARPLRGGSSYALAEPKVRRLLDSRRGTDLERETHCSVVVTRAFPDLVAIAEHLEGLGFTRILLTPATDLEGRTNGFREEDLPQVLEQLDRLADDYEERVLADRPVAATWFTSLMSRLQSGERKTSFCGGGRDYLGVSADGNVYLCYRFFEDEGFGMGSVQEGLEGGVTQALDAHPLDERTACGRCWARWFCGGGCHHENVHVGGGLGDPNPVTCETFRHGMGRTLDAWARLTRAGKLGARSPVSASRDDGGSRSGGMEPDETKSFEDADRPAVVEGCHVRELEGEKLVYDPQTHELTVLNATAAFVFERCDGEHSVGTILADLRREFAAPEDVLRGDLLATLADLRVRRLLR